MPNFDKYYMAHASPGLPLACSTAWFRFLDCAISSVDPEVNPLTPVGKRRQNKEWINSKMRTFNSAFLFKGGITRGGINSHLA